MLETRLQDMKRRILLSVPLLVCTVFVGCSSRSDMVDAWSEWSDMIDVRVVMHSKGPAFRPVNHRILDFTSRKPRVSSGKRISVTEGYPGPDKFARFVEDNPSIDIVICDSPEEVAMTPFFQRAATKTVNACNNGPNCPAFILPGVPSEKREAVEQVFKAITEDQR